MKKKKPQMFLYEAFSVFVNHFKWSCINNSEEFYDYIKKAEYYPDSDIILRGWLKRSNVFKKVVW